MTSILEDTKLIERWAPTQRGVFAKSDLQSLLADPHTNSFYRRLRTLEGLGVLKRATRGLYVASDFSLAALSQRICETSYISFETVLAEALVIGTVPQNQLAAVKVGKSRDYQTPKGRVIHRGVDEQLYFGFEVRDAITWALPEKALLDTLYFHMHGSRFVFDIYSDLNFEPVNQKRLRKFLECYQNPRFVRFVENFIEGANETR